jgi:hypothetical protein
MAAGDESRPADMPAEAQPAGPPPADAPPADAPPADAPPADAPPSFVLRKLTQEERAQAKRALQARQRSAGGVPAPPAAAGVNRPAPAALTAQSAAVREDMVQTAVKFLSSPQVATTPLARRVAFLEDKQLTPREIQVALERAASAVPAASAAPPAAGPTGHASTSPATALTVAVPVAGRSAPPAGGMR